MTFGYFINRVTSVAIWGPWIFYGIWELTVIGLHRWFPEVRTISAEARSVGARGLVSLPYVMAGMCTHYFVNWKRIPWQQPWDTLLSVLWWLGLAAYLVSDLLWPESRVFLRRPDVAALIGGVGGWLLFGQKALW